MRSVATLLVLLAAGPAAAQMYKCTSERGVVQYTDKPGTGCKEVDIRPSPPISGALQPPSDDLARREAEFRKRQLDREASDTQARQAQLMRCVGLRREQTVLGVGGRVARANEQGEREYLEDAARERRLAELRQELASCP
jgi:hypothetical protein